MLQYSFSGSPVDSELDSSPLLSPQAKQAEVRARKRPWVRVPVMRMPAVYRSAVSRVESAIWASACTGDLLDVLAQTGVGRAPGELLELGSEAREGSECRAADGEEGGEAADDVVVRRSGDAAAGAVEAGDVQAALMHMQEAAVTV